MGQEHDQSVPHNDNHMGRDNLNFFYIEGRSIEGVVQMLWTTAVLPAHIARHRRILDVLERLGNAGAS